MARLIDADALVGLVKGYGCDKCPGGALQCTFCTLNQFVAMIDSAPTVDAAPVRRGEWRYVNYQTDKTTWITGEFICRKCGKSVPRHMGDNPPDYCQHCGADMRGETHGTD